MPGRRDKFGRGLGRGRCGNLNKTSPDLTKRNLSPPKRIKTEKLMEVGYIVSPDSKRTKFTIRKVIDILKNRDNTDFKEDELREMLSCWRKFKKKKTYDIKTMNYHDLVQELQMVQKQLLLQEECDFAIDEVEAILRETKIQQLSKTMDTEQLREMLKVWNHHNQYDNSKIKEIPQSEIVSQLKKVQASLNDNNIMQPSKSMIEEVDQETDHIFEVVKKMNITEKTSDEQIWNFDDEELAYFQYVKSLKDDDHLGLDDLKEKDRNQLIDYCKEWINSEREKVANNSATHMLLSSEDEDDLYQSNTEIERPNSEDVIMIDKDNDSKSETNTFDDFNMKNATTKTSVDPMNMIPKESDENSPTQDSNQTDILNIQQFRDLEDNNKYTWITKQSAAQGEPINLETVKLWSNDQLNNIAQNLLNPAVQNPQTNTTKPSLKRFSKYAGKPSIQTNLHNQVMKTWRYSLFLTSNLEKKSIEGLIQYLSDIFHEMGSFCQGIQLLPWDETNLDNGIEDCEEIPKTISQLKKYFKGARSPAGNTTKQYLKIRLGYPIHSDRSTFEADIMEWCKEREIRMYECPLQLPNTKVIGWLSYMPNTVNREKWCRATQELYQMVNKSERNEEIQVGLAWKALNGQWNIQQKQKVYAFHVETSIDQATRIKKFLRLVAQNKKYPLGVRFRLCDEYSQYMKETSRIKYTYMRDKHKTLCKEMRQVETETIINLDRKIGDTKLTLRDIVLSIRDKTDTRRVFNSIDQKYNNPTTYVAQYRPDKAELAKAYMQSLSTYVKHLYPQTNLSKIFTIDSIEEASIETYYPNTQTFITQEDMDFDAVIQEDLDDDSFEYLNVNNINPFKLELPEKLKGGEKLYNFNGDDDTASTMPAHSSTISFTDASVHLYDTKSLVSEISNLSDTKKKQPTTNTAKSKQISRSEEEYTEEANQA